MTQLYGRTVALTWVEESGPSARRFVLPCAQGRSCWREDGITADEAFWIQRCGSSGVGREPNFSGQVRYPLIVEVWLYGLS
jgi:hypothetical protein